MTNITKKEIIDRIADRQQQKRIHVKRIIQQFLDEIVEELGRGNRLEFRDFGVFENKTRKSRKAQNPRTLQPLVVPEKRTVKFKVGRLMRKKLADLEARAGRHSETQGRSETHDRTNASPGKHTLGGRS